MPVELQCSLHVPRGDVPTALWLGAYWTKWESKWTLVCNATRYRSKEFRPWRKPGACRKLRLRVAYAERDEAKRFGCSWDAGAGVWMFETALENDRLPAWVQSRIVPT